MIDFLDISFLVLYLIMIAIIMLKCEDVIIQTQSIIFFAFFVAAHMAWRQSVDYSYDTYVYFLTHLMTLIYFALLAFLMRKGRQRTMSIMSALQSLPMLAFIVPVLLWFCVSAYIYQKYGFLGFIEDENAVGSAAETMANGDLAINTIANALVNGTTLAFAGRAALEPKILKRPIIVIPLLIFVSLMLGLGAGNMSGARRTLLIWIVFFIVVSLRVGRMRGAGFSNLRRVFIGIILFSITGLYYQSIRANFYNPEVSSALASSKLDDKVKALQILFTPSDEEKDTAESFVNRSGPFDLFYLMNVSVFEYNMLEGGHLTGFSIAKAVPKLFYPEKPEYDIDIEILRDLGPSVIRDGQSSQVYIDGTDLSSSVLSILVADFGFIGCIIAPIIFYFLFVICVYFIRTWPNRPIMIIGALSCIFSVFGGIENSLDAQLSNVRGLLIFAGLSILAGTCRNIFFPPRYSMSLNNRTSSRLQKKVLVESSPLSASSAPQPFRMQ